LGRAGPTFESETNFAQVLIGPQLAAAAVFAAEISDNRQCIYGTPVCGMRALGKVR
jgi:hypothetical protein